MKYSDILLILEEAIEAPTYSIDRNSFPSARRAYDLKVGDTVKTRDGDGIVTNIQWEMDTETGNVLPLTNQSLITIKIDDMVQQVVFAKIDKQDLTFHSKRSWMLGMGEPRHMKHNRQWKRTPQVEEPSPEVPV
jgi:hypothetical protein